MNQPGTSLPLMGLTLISAVATALSWFRLRHALSWPVLSKAKHGGQVDHAEPSNKATSLRATSLTQRIHVALVAAVMVGSAMVVIVRWMRVGAIWQPLHAHVDGLTLIAALLAGVVLFMLVRPGWSGVSAFALPVLTFILSWAICASAWTYRPFNLQAITPIWAGLHLVGVYLGTLFAALGAVAGGMYLYVQHRLKRKAALPAVGRLASLETLETLVIRAATGGFILLSLGLIAGIIMVAQEPRALSSDWWYEPKIVLAAVVWLVYGLLINVRFTASFRGARAAWLAIVGLVLLIATYGVITVMPNQTTAQADRAGFCEPAPNSQTPALTSKRVGSGKNPGQSGSPGLITPRVSREAVQFARIQRAAHEVSGPSAFDAIAQPLTSCAAHKPCELAPTNCHTQRVPGRSVL